MIPTNELDRIRMHIAVRNGYRRIERNQNSIIVGNRTGGESLHPIPDYATSIRAAIFAFEYLSGQLMHDLNHMRILLDTWEDQIDPIPQRAMVDTIKGIESWILHMESTFERKGRA